MAGAMLTVVDVKSFKQKFLSCGHMHLPERVGDDDGHLFNVSVDVHECICAE